MTYDLIIRGGTVVDGTGAEPYVADVAVKDGRIAAIGQIADRGAKELDAAGLLVTPGFVDVHTHYDGQAIWSDRMAPSSSHGVTTVVMGNCGVGFAPCRPEHHDMLINVMAGVEDIPGVVMADGLPWNWETFPEYLNALDARPRDIDVAAYLPHSPLRVYVMGERGAAREEATPDDLARMRALAKEAAEVGALGFASSRLIMHKTFDGQAIPSWNVAEAELEAIAEGLKDGGGGLMQFVPEIPSQGYRPILEPLMAIARKAGLPATFTLATGNDTPPFWQEALDVMEESNAAGGDVKAQMFPRPIGMVLGLEVTAHPFVLCPTYEKLAKLPLAERVAELRKPEVRAQILSEPPHEGHPLTQMARQWNWIFPLAKEPNYEPPRSESIAARAAARGVTPEEEAYDRLLDDDGHALLLLALGNYQDGSLDTLAGLLRRDDVVVGLGDGGAHYGMICDASFPTFMLAHWTRDRQGLQLGLAETIKALTQTPANLAGLSDRGRIAVGYKADLNLIDHAAVRLDRPVIVRDLPGGGRRLDQSAHGYVATIVSGQLIAENGQPTDARPGRLVRGRQAAPAAA